MRAIVLHTPGDLRIEEQEKPVPGPGEVLVRIERGGICGSTSTTSDMAASARSA